MAFRTSAPLLEARVNLRLLIENGGTPMEIHDAKENVIGLKLGTYEFTTQWIREEITLLDSQWLHPKERKVRKKELEDILGVLIVPDLETEGTPMELRIKQEEDIERKLKARESAIEAIGKRIHELKVMNLNPEQKSEREEALYYLLNVLTGRIGF